MVLYSQLVCTACRKVLTYPLGAISCKCRNCHRINPSLHMEVMCERCETTMYLPANTLTALCPCCFTVTEIPVDKLPMIEGPAVLEGEDEDENDKRKNAKTIYVEHMPSSGTGRPKVSVATQIPLGPLPDEGPGHLEEEGGDSEGSSRPRSGASNATRRLGGLFNLAMGGRLSRGETNNTHANNTRGNNTLRSGSPSASASPPRARAGSPQANTGNRR